MENLHYVQMKVLRDLLFTDSKSFSELNDLHLGSEQFSYHLKQLIDQKLVSKDIEGRYSLTNEGKAYAQNIDINSNTLEERPKLSVLNVITREVTTSTGEKSNEILVIERLKAPLKNKLCFIAGKVKYGDSTIDTAKREAMEEAGIRLLNPEYKCLVRQFIYNTEYKLLSDTAFCVIYSTEIQGVVKETEEAKPLWLNENEFNNHKGLAFGILDFYTIATNPPKEGFIEKKYITNEF